MAGTAVFQSTTLATPGAGIVVATDNVSGTQYQEVKLDIGPAGTTVLLHYAAGTGLPVQGVGTFQALGTVQTHGTSQVLGTVQPLAGSVHLANTLPGGTVVAVGSAVHGAAADTRPLLISAFGSSGTQAAVDDGDAVRLWADLNGRLQVRGTIDSLPTVTVQATNLDIRDLSSASDSVTVTGTVQTHGTSQVLGTIQPLAGSVHLASNLPGGSINAQGVVAHGAAAAGNPVLFGGFGSSGTQAAVDDGDLVRPWYDLNGRAQIRGTIDSLVGTVQTHGTSQILGTVQTHGTTQALGTVQPLAGSVHLATNLPGGTVVAVGSAVHGAAADTRPLLMSAFGSSGTQAAVDDGDAVRLWADLNGRLQVRGTIDSMPTVTVQATNLDIRDLSSASDSVTVVGTVQTHGTSQVLGTVQTHGTSQALGTVQPLAGSVHLATSLPGGTIVSVGSAVHGGVADTRPHLISAFGSSGTQAAVDDGDAVRLWADLNGRLQVRGTIDSLVGTVQTHGTSQVLGTVQAHGSIQILGSVQTHGTSQVLGTTQPLAGSVHPAAALPGTSHVTGTVRTMAPVYVGESHFGTVFTAAVTNGTLIPAPAQGTYVRVYDVMVNGSAAGTALLELGDGTAFGHVFLADKGGWSFNSSKGVKSRGTSYDMLFNCSAGSWGVMVNYALEI